MAVAVDPLVDDIQRDLQDVGGTRWVDATVIAFLNAGQREIVELRPDAAAATAAAQLVAGARQTLPAGKNRLLRPGRNMGTNGTTPGREATIVPREDLAAAVPGWSTAPPSPTVRHVLYNAEVDPAEYYVYPPQPATGQGYLELTTSGPPIDAAAAGNLTIADWAREPLHYYALFRAYAADTDEASAARAGEYYQLFMQALGLRTAGEEGARVARRAAR